MFKLKNYIDSRYIVKNGSFNTLASAKNELEEGILCYAANLEYLKIAEQNPKVTAIITHPSLQNETTKSLIIHDEPDILYAEVLNKLILEGVLKPKMTYKISESAIIDYSAIVSKKSYIGKNVQIGRNVIIHDYTIIEDNCIVGDNVVLGCEGFYFKRDKTGKLVKFLHAGGVRLEKDVEIMTNSLVQKAHDCEFTTIGEGTKISVNCNISHSVVIGKHNMITGNVQIAGRAKIGDYCWIGNSSTISDSVEIGNNVKVRIGSVVISNLCDGADVSGNFAYAHAKKIKNFIKEQR